MMSDESEITISADLLGPHVFQRIRGLEYPELYPGSTGGLIPDAEEIWEVTITNHSGAEVTIVEMGVLYKDEDLEKEVKLPAFSAAGDDWGVLREIRNGEALTHRVSLSPGRNPDPSRKTGINHVLDRPPRITHCYAIEHGTDRCWLDTYQGKQLPPPR